MFEPQKQKERDHYNNQVKEVIHNNFAGFDWRYGSQKCEPVFGIPFIFTENKIKEIIRSKAGKTVKILDFGCGTGIHSIYPATLGAQVYGIDIAEKSIRVAKEWAKRVGVEGKTNFSQMDCEKIEFEDNFFDIAFNSGTLSCIDRHKGCAEIARVLKPDGYLLSVDTLSHNPILNFNRRIKLMRGLRTRHTYNHILKMEDIEAIKNYFAEGEVYFFNLATLAAVPFQHHAGGKQILSFLEKIDERILNYKPLQKYAFKTVFEFSHPKK